MKRNGFGGIRIGGGLLGALLMASARSCGPPGWTPPPAYSSVVSEADQTYLARYVPDDGGPSLVYEVPPMAFAKGFEAEEWNGTFEVLEPDCTVVGSIPMQLLIIPGPETIIGSDGQPRESDVPPDDQRAPDDELELLPGTCPSPQPGG